jgi:hypothetical protein
MMGGQVSFSMESAFLRSWQVNLCCLRGRLLDARDAFAVSKVFVRIKRMAIIT